mmetsp:Transcript_157046/g.301342  ORF Transcript_157046/g.301342 Transcript_157046/m.301342 type:complete len:95 (-) Transcript_157046:1-285(-)
MGALPLLVRLHIAEEPTRGVYYPKMDLRMIHVRQLRVCESETRAPALNPAASSARQLEKKHAKPCTATSSRAKPSTQRRVGHCACFKCNMRLEP